MKLVKEEPYITDDVIKYVYLRGRKGQVERTIKKWYLRMDKPVTKDISRLMRLPGSVHGGTNRVTRLISPSNLLFFSPEEENQLLAKNFLASVI